MFGGNKDENLIPVGSRTKEELREMARKARGNPCRTLGVWMDETPMGIATGGYGSIMAVELRANLGEMCYLLICLVGCFVFVIFASLPVCYYVNLLLVCYPTTLEHLFTHG